MSRVPRRPHTREVWRAPTYRPSPAQQGTVTCQQLPQRQGCLHPPPDITRTQYMIVRTQMSILVCPVLISGSTLTSPPPAGTRFLLSQSTEYFSSQQPSHEPSLCTALPACPLCPWLCQPHGDIRSAYLPHIERLRARVLLHHKELIPDPATLHSPTSQQGRVPGLP